MSRNNKLKVLGEVQKILGVDDANLEKLPQLVRSLVQAAATEPCLVAFSFDLRTGRLRQIAASRVPQVPEAYARIAQVTTGVAQQFQNIALEVAKHVGETQGVGGSQETYQNDESRTGPSPGGHEVGEVASARGSPGDSNK